MSNLLKRSPEVSSNIDLKIGGESTSPLSKRIPQDLTSSTIRSLEFSDTPLWNESPNIQIERNQVLSGTLTLSSVDFSPNAQHERERVQSDASDVDHHRHAKLAYSISMTEDRTRARSGSKNVTWQESLKEDTLAEPPFSSVIETPLTPVERAMLKTQSDHSASSHTLAVEMTDEQQMRMLGFKDSEFVTILNEYANKLHEMETTEEEIHRRMKMRRKEAKIAFLGTENEPFLLPWKRFYDKSEPELRGVRQALSHAYSTKGESAMEWFGEFVDLIFVAAIYNIVSNMKYEIHYAYKYDKRSNVSITFWESAVMFTALYAFYLEHFMLWSRFTHNMQFAYNACYFLYACGFGLFSASIHPEGRIFSRCPGLIFGFFICFATFIGICILNLYHASKSSYDYNMRRIWTLCMSTLILFPSFFIDDPSTVSVLCFLSFVIVIYIEIMSCRVDTRSEFYPLNVEYVNERLGIFVMIMLGESILSLVIGGIQDQYAAEHYIVLASSFGINQAIFYAFYKHCSVHLAFHALRNNEYFGSCMHVFLHYPLGLALLWTGFGFKLLVYLEEPENKKKVKDDEKIFNHFVLATCIFFSFLLTYLLKFTHKHVTATLVSFIRLPVMLMLFLFPLLEAIGAIDVQDALVFIISTCIYCVTVLNFVDDYLTNIELQELHEEEAKEAEERRTEYEEMKRLKDAERFALGMEAGRGRALAQARYHSMIGKMELEPSTMDPDHEDEIMEHPKLDAMIDSRLVKMAPTSPPIEKTYGNSLRDHWRKSQMMNHSEKFMSIIFNSARESVHATKHLHSDSEGDQFETRYRGPSHSELVQAAFFESPPPLDVESPRPLKTVLENGTTSHLKTPKVMEHHFEIIETRDKLPLQSEL